MQFTDKEFIKKYAEIVVRAWDDEDYKKKLISNPEKVLKKEGIIMPCGISVKVIDGETKQSYDLSTKNMILPLPQKPQDNGDFDLDDEHNLLMCCCCCCLANA